MRVLVLIALAACSTTEAPAPAPAPVAPPQVAAAASTWAECAEPYRAKLETTLGKRHGLDRGDAAIDGARCLTIQLDRRPAFYVELIGVDERAAHRKLRGVVAFDATTELVALHDADLDWAQLEGGQASFEAVDLDGDGTDELVAHRSDDRHALDEWIDVVRVRTGSLRGPRISYDNTRFDPEEIEKCTGTLAQVKRGVALDLVLTTLTSTGKGEHCRSIGKHVFTLSGDQLVEH